MASLGGNKTQGSAQSLFIFLPENTGVHFGGWAGFGYKTPGGKLAPGAAFAELLLHPRLGVPF